MIEGLEHVAIGVIDPEKAKAFYQEVLGFQVFLEREVDNPHVRKVVFMRKGEDTIELLHMPGLTAADGDSHPSKGRTGLAHICFKVRDFSAEVKRWLGLGIPQLVPPSPTPDGSMRAVFQGPAGEQIELRGR